MSKMLINIRRYFGGIIEFIDDLAEETRLWPFVIILYSFFISVTVNMSLEKMIANDSLVFLISLLTFILTAVILRVYQKFSFYFGVFISILLSVIYSTIAYTKYGIFTAISTFIILMIIFFCLNFKPSEK
ncbi:hypothetical protein CEQ07_03760 [Oligella urethralis]|uniref:hypothetical protein n=1 Tax=Oligella urethralis TaxID=90245 RepID=UPI000D00EA4E|nr:hypothetical protein [Oligella urethralis]AVL70620.1 hypothetical protein CEQ07_03760 [Oligella urethralis]